MVTQRELYRLLSILDATSDPPEGFAAAIADALEYRGRYYEACILREQQMYAIRVLRCGHCHLRPIGVGFDIGQLGPCAWTGGQEE